MKNPAWLALALVFALPAVARAQSIAQHPASPRNYTATPSHKDMVVIHKAEGSGSSTWAWFQNPAAQCSAHYVVDSDGSVSQMVEDEMIAWHTGNWDYNVRSIGIENGGFTAKDDISDNHLRALAALTRSLCDRYGIPKDRQHIIGHQEVPDPDHPGEFGGSGHHTDPGSFFNWPLFMKYVRGESDAPAAPPATPPAADPAPAAPAAPAGSAPAPSAPAPKAPEDLTVQIGEGDSLPGEPGKDVISGPDALDKLLDEIADPRRKTGELPKLGKITLEDAPGDPLRDLRFIFDVLGDAFGFPAPSGLDANFGARLAAKLAERGLTPDDVFAPDAKVIVTNAVPESAGLDASLAAELPKGAKVVDASRPSPGFIGPVASKTIDGTYTPSSDAPAAVASTKGIAGALKFE